MKKTIKNSPRTKFTIGQLAVEAQPHLPIEDAIRTRRTVRRYQDKLIPKVKIESLLRLSTHAPSACNRRGWRFILIENPEILTWLYKKGGAAFIPKAKQAILVSYFRHTDNMEWRDREQSAAAAIAFFQLLAHKEGIGSCWICHLPPKREVKKFFHIPPNYIPIALLTIGFYPEDMHVIERYIDNEEILSVDYWTFSNAPNKDVVGPKLFIKKVLRKTYYLFPKREWLRDLTHKYEKKFHNDD